MHLIELRLDNITLSFPPCWELRILRNIRLSIIFSSGESLPSVDDDDEDDDDENDGLFLALEAWKFFN